jgi:plasmid maintenance system antidote protein VapI
MKKGMESNRDTQKVQISVGEYLKENLKERGMCQADLVRSSLILKGTLSRICKNELQVTLHQFMALCVGMKFNHDKAKEFFYIAFPEMALLGNFLEEKTDIIKVNEILENNGFALLGSPTKE